jgi:hypothetical protein
MKLRIVSAVLLLSFFVVSVIACGAKEVTYTIDLVNEGLAGVTFNPEGPYAPMQEVTITSIPLSGLFFGYWSYRDAHAATNVDFINSYDNPLTLTMYNDITLEVHAFQVGGVIRPTPPSTKTTLGAPQLTSPENGATTFDNTPLFTWTSVVRVGSYALQVATSPAFGDADIVINCIATSFQSYESNTELANGTYYWHVKCASSTIETPWSSLGVFTIDAE